MTDLVYNTNNTNAPVAEKEFVTVVNKLSIEVGTAITYSGNLSDMLFRLDNFNLKADEKATEPSDKKSDNSVLDALKTLAFQLESVNKRNNEILAHLDKLV